MVKKHSYFLMFYACFIEKCDAGYFFGFGQVMEILSHINKRVKHRPEIPLPMLDLWKIYTESASSTIVRNFCVVYIEMAFERLPTEVFSFPLLISNFI